MFNMSDLSVAFKLTEKSHIFPLEDASLDYTASNFLRHAS